MLTGRDAFRAGFFLGLGLWVGSCFATGCAAANDRAGDAALTAGGAAAGSAIGGPLWAGVAAAAASMWNWLGGTERAEAFVPPGPLDSILDPLRSFAWLIAFVLVLLALACWRFPAARAFLMARPLREKMAARRRLAATLPRPQRREP